MIITIDRQCGCGGHRVGVLLAEKLGLELYDKKKLLEESKKIGKFEENSDFFDEKSVNSLLYSIAMNYGERNPMTNSNRSGKQTKKESSSINPAPIPPGVIRTSISCLLIPVLWASNNLLS